MNSRALVAVMSPLLALLGFTYAFVMLVRAWFYHVGVLPSEGSGSFIVSIGNIQAGGTGKTPVVEFFARRWRGKVRLGIVSRGYGRTTKGSHRVDSNLPEAVELFGDEPTWLAKELSTEADLAVPVQVGEKRVVAARDLVSSEGLKLILLDDGFQHLALRRSFDIVLIDASAPSWHWKILPWGRLREPVTALQRADLIILTKTEAVSEHELLALEKKVRRWAGDVTSDRLSVIRLCQSIECSAGVEGERLLLVAGLARPDSFFATVRNHESQPIVVETISFRDHHLYCRADVERIKARARALNVTKVLVTEKDAIKLLPLWANAVLKSAPAEMEIELIVSKLDVRAARESDERQLERLDDIIIRQIPGVPRKETGGKPGARNQLSAGGTPTKLS